MSDTTNYLIENMRKYSSAAAEESKQLKVGAGRLFRITVVNVNAAARFLYAFDSAAADAGTSLFPPISIPATGFVDLSWHYGNQFVLGARIHASSTQATFTASSGADLLITASFL